VVITRVPRDDLPDAGAALFAATIRAVRETLPAARIELLIPDLRGEEAPLLTILNARPDILGHNIETVARLYGLRPGADYRRSLAVLRLSKSLSADTRTKSALMLGMGETTQEVVSALEDLRGAGCDFLALGQYLAPSRDHEPVHAYVAPEEFEDYRRRALRLGFRHVESGPYVRSSYRADAYSE
ncbi:MAG: lipoyl synthase, partial [Deltaproteobacteria bacterium]